MGETERLLRSVLVPVEPAGAFSDRLAQALAEVTDAAADELADTELGTMGDPRNWVRPAAAVVVGAAAGGTLILVRARQQQRRRRLTGLAALRKSVRTVGGDVRKRLQVRTVGSDVRKRLQVRTVGSDVRKRLQR